MTIVLPELLARRPGQYRRPGQPRSRLAKGIAALFLASACAAPTRLVEQGIGNPSPPAGEAGMRNTESCFLLYELGVGEVRRDPSAACHTRVTPASTFKIPHALAALDAGVLDGPDARLAYDGSPQSFPSWQRDHTLRSAIRDSVVWYFQRVAHLLGPEREREYVMKFGYGNADTSSGLTSFWLGGSLLVSPEEQMRFLVALFTDKLPVDRRFVQQIQEMLIQPPGVVVNAAGEHRFGPSWPQGTVVRAKTGSARDRTGREVRWLVGEVQRGRHSWIFVTCVVGSGQLPPLTAIDLAARSLEAADVL